ncbi:hypothetical protein V4D30_00740 [Thermodesulfovibrio sp. 3907-1M]|uniref:Uncharacterized protein n=1 Tax=Thermodesulfovibrio autotrophicus TaxID=3118333 RepID=A0AAU8GZK5_9BACT
MLKSVVCIILVTILAFSTLAYSEYIPTPTPVVDCKATLKAWGNPPNCYCPCDTCHPVCQQPQQPQPQQSDKEQEKQ